MNATQMEPPSRNSRSLPEMPHLTPKDPIAEASRRILHYHFSIMQANEPGTRDGVDPEALHDMRVATRRMRAILQLTDNYFEPDTLRPVQKGLRRTGRALGRVRDLDVLRIAMDTYLKDLSAEHIHELDPVLERWEQQHEIARSKMLAYLVSSKYQDFLTLMKHFVQTEGMGTRTLNDQPDSHPAHIQDVVPSLIHEHNEHVLAYGPDLNEASVEQLHALRIDVKRLRYSLEFFKEVLGKEARDVISAAVVLQDHLGELRDAIMAQEFVRNGKKEAQVYNREVAEAYLAYLDKIIAANKAKLPSVWVTFTGSRIQRKLRRAVEVL